MAPYEKITTEDQMVDYIKLLLGMPILCVEVTDDQIKQHIWDSIEEFRRYNYDEGAYKDYAIITLSAGQGETAVSAFSALDGRPLDNVQDIYDFGVSFGMDGINTLFSPAHILLYDSFVNKGQYPGGGGINGLTLTNYYLSMQYLDQIHEMFGKYYTIDYHPGRATLICTPTPATCVTGLLVLYRKELAHYLYNQPLIKKLTIGRVKQQWGRHLNKYNASLPDGISINGSELRMEGKEEADKALQDMRRESQPIDFWVA